MEGVYVTPVKTSQFGQLKKVTIEFGSILARPQVFQIGRKNNVLAVSHVVKSLPDRTCSSMNLEEFTGLELAGGACLWILVVAIGDRAH